MFARTAFALYKLYGRRPYNHLTCILTSAICFLLRKQLLKQLNVAHHVKCGIILGYIVLIILSIES